MIRTIVFARLFIVAGALGNIDFAANQRFDLMLFAGFVKLDGPAHDPVVGHGQSWHSLSGGVFDHIVDAVTSVEQAIFGVSVKVNKLLRF